MGTSLESTKSLSNGFEFVVKIGANNLMTLRRMNGTSCYCPWQEDSFCNSGCPHFVIENCSVEGKRCQLILTCGKYHSRYVEII
jgi:hypothetical protein